MNGTYYKNPTFPSVQDNNYQETISSENNDYKKNIPLNDILKNNIGKKINIYLLYENNERQNYNGIIENVEKDYIIISNPETGNWFLLLLKYLNYIEFEEKINL